MKTQSFKGTVASAYGEELPKPIEVAGTFDAFETADEVRQKYTPTELNELILQSANAAQKANARAKATTAALDAAGIAKPDPNSPEVLRATMVKTLRKSRPELTEEQATQIIAGLLPATVTA